jgi:hypothetical protein
MDFLRSGRTKGAQFVHQAHTALNSWVSRYCDKNGKEKNEDGEVEDLINAFLKVLETKGCNEKTKTFGNMLLSARVLSKQQLEMLNKADELNMMWRDITFVRSRLLTDGIIPNERLAAHLEYCRLECGKICSEKEDSIEQRCHETALEIVDSIFK